MKRTTEEIIYRTNIISRIFLFFFYYWWGFTILLFLPVFIFGVFYYGSEMILSCWNGTLSRSPISWETWFAPPAFALLSWWGAYSVWNGFKNILHPVKLIEGLIIDKEEYYYDEGKSFHIHLKLAEKVEQVEVNEKTYNKLRVGNRVKIIYSNKLDQALKISVLKAAG